MTRTGFIAAVIGTAIVTTAGVVAAGPGGSAGFDMLDRDGNGEITLEEMRGARESRFKAADSNGDGLLSREEMLNAAAAQAAARADRMIERFDSDGDGALSLAELPKHERGGDRAGHMFERADRDNSGGLSREEFEEARERMSHGRGDRHKPDAD
jgi:Ca2+-binding EF-hand superfamily protein